MDDLAAALSHFLESEDGMNQVRAVADALGLGGAPGTGNAGNAASLQAQPAAGANPPALDMGTLMLLQKAIAAFSETDKNTELLRALRPHFSPERARRVDDAIRILQLIRLLPLVKESGLFRREGEP